jgi:hypothetical protein
MDADVCESIKYTLKLISNFDVLRTREEGIHEDISSSNSADDIGYVGKICRSNRRSKKLMNIKQEIKFFLVMVRALKQEKRGRNSKKKRYKQEIYSACRTQTSRWTCQLKFQVLLV